MKNNKVFYKLREHLTKEDRLLFPLPPLPKEASEAEKPRYKHALEKWIKRTGNYPPLPTREN